jgi:(1->4)-alpha-D-glucan 1-alpha-D-glucosylmutase
MDETLLIPRASYRLQFSGAFKFADAQRIASYLARLGISHVYASPYLKARAGSTHGYDITDHNTFNPEIGDDAAFLSFSDELQRYGLGQILDFVPNHMGIGRDDNAWWLDVLEWGEESPFAEYFDIDWSSAKIELRDKVMLPFLGDHYGRVLEAGDLKLGFDVDNGTFSVWYYEHRFPINPGTYPSILRPMLREYAGLPDQDSAIIVELEDLIGGFRDVGDASAASLRRAEARRAEADRLKLDLAELVRKAPAIGEVIDITFTKLNGKPGDPDSLNWMHELLEQQNYRLAYWRVAAEEINYRRFFQINELAGIRIELPNVFDAAHRLVFALIRQGRLHGLRIDHVDGLFDPKQYLERLQTTALDALSGEEAVSGASAERTENGGEEKPLFYVVVEKILAGHERLREDWPIAGTTGYEFLNRVHGLFVDADNYAAMKRVYERFVGSAVSFEEIAYDGKRQVMDFELASELRVLANEYDRLTETSWLTRDYTLVGLRQALREVVAAFPVYRTYVDAEGATAPDRRDIDWAIAHARRRSVRADKSVFDFIQSAITTDLAAAPSPYNRREVRRLAQKFQQYTGPVAAKGVEDTAFYRYNLLASNNEVGGEPARFGTTVSAFHKMTQDAARRWPLTMLSTATHDTKRGEDARVRIHVLSEIPTEWGRRVRRWATLNHRRKVLVNDEPAPTLNDEYLFYQALVGSWPVEFHEAGELDPQAVDAFRERASNYMIKAVREAKTHSSWINPNNDYEEALLSLIGRCLDVSRSNPFIVDFRDFHRQVAVAGMLNSLSQLVLKLTSPGVPDIYQGCEFWDLSMVDPDNRRPVDFTEREQRLAGLADRFEQQGGTIAPALLEHWTDASVKLFVIWRLLSLRSEQPLLFRNASYTPIEVTGHCADNLCAFLRSEGAVNLLVVVPRLMIGLLKGDADWPLGEEIWGDTTLLLPAATSQATWRNVFTSAHIDGSSAVGEVSELAVAAALGSFPVAVLVQPSTP